jgi:large subunit ribosomal protein L1
MIRGVCSLPHGLGKTIRVVVFAGAEGAEEARAAGADFVGEDDLIEKIEGGWTDFEVGLATPQIMPKIGKLGRILGRRGLMPNPRNGTMVQPQDLPRAIQEAKGGRTEYRTDRTAIIHCSVGKVSFESDMLVDNLAALASAIIRDQPDTMKGPFFRSAYLTSSMGPGLNLDLPALQALEAPE